MKKILLIFMFGIINIYAAQDIRQYRISDGSVINVSRNFSSIRSAMNTLTKVRSGDQKVNLQVARQIMQDFPGIFNVGAYLRANLPVTLDKGQRSLWQVCLDDRDEYLLRLFEALGDDATVRFSRKSDGVKFSPMEVIPEQFGIDTVYSLPRQQDMRQMSFGNMVPQSQQQFTPLSAAYQPQQQFASAVAQFQPSQPFVTSADFQPQQPLMQASYAQSKQQQPQSFAPQHQLPLVASSAAAQPQQQQQVSQQFQMPQQQSFASSSSAAQPQQPQQQFMQFTPQQSQMSQQFQQQPQSFASQHQLPLVASSAAAQPQQQQQFPQQSQIPQQQSLATSSSAYQPQQQFTLQQSQMSQQFQQQPQSFASQHQLPLVASSAAAQPQQQQVHVLSFPIGDTEVFVDLFKSKEVLAVIHKLFETNALWPIAKEIIANVKKLSMQYAKIILCDPLFNLNQYLHSNDSAFFQSIATRAIMYKSVWQQCIDMDHIKAIKYFLYLNANSALPCKFVDTRGYRMMIPQSHAGTDFSMQDVIFTYSSSDGRGLICVDVQGNIIGYSNDTQSKTKNLVNITPEDYARVTGKREIIAMFDASIQAKSARSSMSSASVTHEGALSGFIAAVKNWLPFGDGK